MYALISCPVDMNCVATVRAMHFSCVAYAAHFLFLGDTMKILEWVVKFFSFMLAGVIISLMVVIFVSEDPQPQQVSTQPIYVYIAKNGEKYHHEDCDYLKYTKIKITLEDARNNGYSPCSVCTPQARP